MKQIKSFINDESGAELAEYAVAVALLVAIAVVVYAVLGNAINDQNSGTGAKVKMRRGARPINRPWTPEEDAQLLALLESKMERHLIAES